MARPSRPIPERAAALPMQSFVALTGELDVSASASPAEEAAIARRINTPVCLDPRSERPEPPRISSSSFAHEIRNSLHRALLHLMLLEREHERLEVGPGALKPAAALRTEILQISSVVTDYLDWRRRSTAGAPLTLRQACARAVEQVTPDADKARVEIATELGGEATPGVDLDPMERMVVRVLNCAVGSARADSKLLVWSHDIGPEAAIEINWELVPEALGTGALESTLDVLSKHGAAVEVRTGPDRARIHVTLSLASPTYPKEEE
jgi:signal transduction histidine kinase